jgi:stress response protein YsnF
MLEIGGLLAAVLMIVVVICILIAVIIYSIRLQRRAVVTQTAVVDDHFSEKAQRQRHLALAEEALEIQRHAVARDEQAIDLLRRTVQLNEEILSTLRGSRGRGNNDA